MGKRDRAAGRESSRALDRAVIDDAARRYNISDLAGRRTKLRKQGAEFVGLCPFHSEKSPSFYVNDAKATYHCYGCGAGGDIIRLVMELEGQDFVGALRWLGASGLPAADPEQRARAAEEDAAAREAAIADARTLWNTSTKVEGTPAERYLRSRGIVAPPPPSIRFGMVPLSRDPDTGDWREPMPALLGAITMAGELVAIQRIFLRDDGADKRWRKPRRSKFSLGRVKGGALRLDHFASGGEVVITEGPEDALSLAQEMPGKRVWAALGTDMMPAIQFPDEVNSIIIAGQNDDAGRAAVDRAAESLLVRGYAVRATYPDPQFKDWNDQLRGIAR